MLITTHHTVFNVLELGCKLPELIEFALIEVPDVWRIM